MTDPELGRITFFVGACREMNLPSLVLMICPASGFITTFCGDFTDNELILGNFFLGLESKLGMAFISLLGRIIELEISEKLPSALRILKV